MVHTTPPISPHFPSFSPTSLPHPSVSILTRHFHRLLIVTAVFSHDERVGRCVFGLSCVLVDLTVCVCVRRVSVFLCVHMRVLRVVRGSTRPVSSHVLTKHVWETARGETRRETQGAFVCMSSLPIFPPSDSQQCVYCSADRSYVTSDTIIFTLKIFLSDTSVATFSQRQCFLFSVTVGKIGLSSTSVYCSLLSSSS